MSRNRPHVDISYGDAVYRTYGRGEWWIKRGTAKAVRLNGIYIPAEVLKIAACPQHGYGKAGVCLLCGAKAPWK